MSQSEVLKVVNKVNIFASKDDLNIFIKSLPNAGGVKIISFLNQHGFNLIHKNESMRKALISSDIVFRDGVGLEVGLRFMGRDSGVNANGSDIIPVLLNEMRNKSIAVFGTRDPWLTGAAEKIASLGINVVASIDGFQDDEVYLNIAKSLRPNVILLGMGMPRQEILSVKLRECSVKPCIIINGGAVLDFMSNRFPRAPRWIQQMRGEWLYRILQEPQRLMKRYVSGGLVFTFNMVNTKFYAYRHLKTLS